MHFCIMGCGEIARTHARVLRKLRNFVPGHTIRFSFASRDAAKARGYREKFGGDLALTSYEEAFSHDRIDVVVLCTPNGTHRDLALAALEHGKHLIIEKPIACTVAEADEILAKAKSHGRHVLVAENHRYRPNVRAIERLVESGTLGVIKVIRMTILRMRRLRPEEWRAIRNQMGGGPLIDSGIHWVNVLLTLARDRPISITAYQPPITNQPSAQEDSIVITCQFQNGAVGILTCSWGVQGVFPIGTFAVHGSAGSIYSLNSGEVGLMNRRFFRPMFFSIRDRQGFQAMWQDFLHGFANSNPESCLMNGEIGRRDLAFIEQAYRSVAKN